ncbi:MAG: DUF2461 domain-containing protein [Bacteroidota bacterium]
MPKITQSTFQFLTDLKKNNDRDWFHGHKKVYEKAKQEFTEFIDALIIEIAKFDKEVAHFTAKETIFRIHRDVRFSKDKSPYKTHMGAHITSAPKKSEIHTRAGYYIHLEPGGSMLAGGAYLPESGWLKAIRQEISYNADSLKKIINGPDFKKYFGEIEGEKLKTAPKDYPKDHPEIDLLKHKSFLATHQCTNAEVLSDDFLSHCTKVFQALYPFDQFLNQASD